MARLYQFGGYKGRLIFLTGLYRNPVDERFFTLIYGTIFLIHPIQIHKKIPGFNTCVFFVDWVFSLELGNC